MATLPSMLRFHPQWPIIRQSLDHCDVQDDIKACTSKFPDLQTADAFFEYIDQEKVPGLFFLNSENERCLWGESIKFWGRPSHPDQRLYRSCIDARNRKYTILMYREVLKKHIDIPRPQSDTDFVAHVSEKGWHLPKDHKRHLLQFPQEVLNVIFEMVLIPQVPYSHVNPEVISCNWQRHMCSPRLSVSAPSLQCDMYNYSGPIELRVVSLHDDHGQYKLLRQIRRGLVDATFLRAGRELYQTGSSILYGSNYFRFKMRGPTMNKSPPTLYSNKKKSTFWRPNPKKPKADTKWQTTVDFGIKQIERQVYFKSVPGWLYFDPFLRFLYTIGPKNAAMIKNLNFSGIVRLHNCHERESPDCTGNCDDDLTTNIELYIPFIIKFCTNLQYLYIDAEVDEKRSTESHEAYPGTPTCVSESLLPLLAGNLRKITTLRCVEVGVGWNCWQDRDDEYEWEPALLWFRVRRRAQMEKLRLHSEGSLRGIGHLHNSGDAKEESNLITDPHDAISCDFCGEAHVWPDCWNLCSVCGSYGHLG